MLNETFGLLLPENVIIMAQKVKNWHVKTNYLKKLVTSKISVKRL